LHLGLKLQDYFPRVCRKRYHSWVVTLPKLNNYDLRGWPKLSKAGCPQLAKLAHVPVKDSRKDF
jgi:hypothetical protein